MENAVRENTKGKINVVDTKFEPGLRGNVTLNTSQTFPNMLDKKIPLHLYQARNAVNIARWSGAETHASATYKKAELLLRQAEQYQAGKRSFRKQVPVIAREAAQTAEDARLIAIDRIEKDKVDLERAESRQSLNRAKDLALEEARTRTKIESEIAASEKEKAGLRAQLVEQLNLILEMRDTARGLIVNMSDILFEPGKYNLPAVMREKLAKISGVILAHPGLKIGVEGHTDSLGSDESNQRLSEQRADSVCDYLIQQGIAAEDISAQGFGETRPIAVNQTMEGRQKNRRVEIVVTGESIEE